MDELKAWFSQRGNSYAKLARALGVYPSAVANWVYRGKVPPERVHQVAKVTKISPSALRPDLFGPDARKVQLPGTTKAAFPQPSGR